MRQFTLSDLLNRMTFSYVKLIHALQQSKRRRVINQSILCSHRKESPYMSKLAILSSLIATFHFQDALLKFIIFYWDQIVFKLLFLSTMEKNRNKNISVIQKHFAMYSASYTSTISSCYSDFLSHKSPLCVLHRHSDTQGASVKEGKKSQRVSHLLLGVKKIISKLVKKSIHSEIKRQEILRMWMNLKSIRLSERN